MDSANRTRKNKYDRVMSRVHNQSRSSLKSSSFVTRHDIPSTARVGAKPAASNVNSGVFNELPTFLYDYVPEPSPEKVKRTYVVKPRKTIKSLDLLASPPRTVTKQSELVKKSPNIRVRESAPSVLFSNGEKWSATHLRECLSSRSHSRLKDLKDEIKAYKETEKLMRLRSSLYRKCGVVLDDVGNVAEDKAVQAQLGEETTDDTGQKELRFFRKYRLPGVLACVDGTHVAIVTPNVHEERYKNRKGYPSINVMIMCDSNLNILCVDASYPGSTHDSVVWANHYLNAYLGRLHRVEGEDVYLLGDSGYPLRPTMMIPITNPSPGTPEEYYQNLHLSARSVVERCIGVLKARFRCLLVDRKMHYAPHVAARITNACCVLHNIAHRAHVAYTPLTAEEAARERRLTEGASGGPAPRAAARRHLTDLELGRARRSAIIHRLWTNRR